MKQTYTIRRSTEADIPQMMAMYDHSRALMRAEGNTTQWTGYPTSEQVGNDIRSGSSFIVQHTTFPVGTFALVAGDEPTYNRIDHGRWIDTVTPYSTLHRLAKTAEVHGVAAAAFAYAKEHCAHLRIDTHATNRTMRKIVESEGFVHCGTVYMADRSPRLAYEWWRWDTVPVDIKAWVEAEVLPCYAHFDTAHRTDHARRVVARAMAMVESGEWLPQLSTFHFPLSTCTYVAAAMHDLGLAEGREEHHLASGRIIRHCEALHRWFTDDEIELMAQAAEDHRASAKEPPRSLPGCIVAEADRDVEPETIVRRTVEYGLSHYPDLDREGHWQRTLDHLHEKYAEGGYIKLWLDPSPNAAPLAELRSLIRDEARLRPLFDELYQKLK